MEELLNQIPDRYSSIIGLDPDDRISVDHLISTMAPIFVGIKPKNILWKVNVKYFTKNSYEIGENC
jgi:hypothetical protein